MEPALGRARLRSHDGQFRTSFASMGTVVEVIAVGEAEPALAGRLAGRCLHAERLWSRFLPDSDVSRLNTEAQQTGEWVRVSAETAAILQLAMTWVQRTDGAFTPLIGPLTKLWDVRTWLRQIAQHSTPPQLPTPAEIDRARERCRPELLESDGDRRFRLREGAQLDLGGLAKGLIADELRGLCQEAGLSSVLVSIGTSSVAACGERAPDVAWRVGLRALEGDPHTLLGSVDLHDASLATSADNLQRLPTLIDGLAVHHVIDPRTGLPSASGVRLASVVARDGLTAEVAATALMVTGELPAQLSGDVEFLIAREDSTVEVSPAGSEIFHRPQVA
ncbi:FAD:protein FMN transferase [Gephyromycinifex aptenodytis]|uniref:FAD:protein FMN transferase n=1 Tax=Gephyromycinifex aptenodytis TaxID=2716227 RepID=UPI001446E8AF|nr:FAD:protein FMN transferase [Gephyromycinifex aptenodytis]